MQRLSFSRKLNKLIYIHEAVIDKAVIDKTLAKYLFLRQRFILVNNPIYYLHWIKEVFEY